MKAHHNKKAKSLNKKPNLRLNTIETESYSKFKNELFQKLFDNNIASKFSKGRISSHGNLHHPKKLTIQSPYTNRNKYKKIKYKIKSPSYVYDVPKTKKNASYVNDIPRNKKEIKMSKSKKEGNTLSNPNSNSAKIIKTNRVIRSNNNTSSNRKLKNYPNLIRGVLHQVNFYNYNNNSNYNESIRYKPVDEFFNEQSQSPIIINNIMENNTNSPNNSFNLDFKPEQKNNQSNNIRKIKFIEEENEQLEKDIRPNNILYRKKNQENNIKNIKNLSPIKIKNIDKHDSNDIINEDIYNDNNNSYSNRIKRNNEINKKNNEDNEFSENIIFYKNKNNDLSLDNMNINVDNGDNDNEGKEENKNKNELLKENIIYLTIFNNINNNKNNVFNNIKLDTGNNFTIKNNRPKKSSYCKLKKINYNEINYIGIKNKTKPKNNNKGPSYDNKGNLVFNNDDEVLKYIKKKIKEEKDMEYNTNKMKYNYFILSKQFHGKLLYEIGLENNLNKINKILEKENVEIEHEPIMFIFKKDLPKLNDNNYINNNLSNHNNKDNEEIENLINEKEKLLNDNQNLLKTIELLKEKNKNLNNNNYNKVNEDEFNRLSQKLEELNEENKKKEKQLNELQYFLNEYENKLKKYDEENYN